MKHAHKFTPLKNNHLRLLNFLDPEEIKCRNIDTQYYIICQMYKMYQIIYNYFIISADGSMTFHYAVRTHMLMWNAFFSSINLMKTKQRHALNTKTIAGNNKVIVVMIF